MVEENRPALIDFSLIPEDDGNDDNPEREGKLVGNKGKLQQILNLTDKGEWMEWLRSCLVQPWWIELWTECLSKCVSGERGVGVGEIQAKILAGEGNRWNEYSDPIPEKKEWSAADHIARFHFMVKTQNLVSNEGVFYSKNFADSYLDKVVWALKGYLTKIHTPSHINKPTGGAAIFGERPSKLKRTESDKANAGSEEHNENELKEAETTQATESEEAVTSQQVDTANEDENDSDDHDGEPLLLDSDLWKNELLSPRKQIVLKKQSTDFNREEAYWQFMLITEALACTQIIGFTDNTPAAVDNDPSSIANTVWEPLVILPGSKKSQVRTETFESSYYTNATDLESSYAGEIDSTKEPSDVIIPTEESIARLQDLKKIINNKDYQHDDHEQACHFLGIWSHTVPHLLYMNCSAILKHWQPVAIAGIVWMWEVDYLQGAVLGDHVGLGKTWEAVGVLLYVTIGRLSSEGEGSI
ncbi:uncharacterized protein ASPGLDRAFT_34929 [Aspergillus glaucus CBS 516.65]|uniref:SNF2 N-terminal domain-containing protein n=1 Tax=Aspergillus glaucus CBS 516.65 TaxID=1160497 RepID=A0A1L9VN09_ASPGL|nr:hypothetical protein ASPGLDRAFT_34929 [Aspergillus glaucus CBS 516.65]OJJ85305.1 hypothetical protein ASPGLDRAFT_34929 [Aspergillus glaucus CBS 516.65]